MLSVRLLNTPGMAMHVGMRACTTLLAFPNDSCNGEAAVAM